MSTQVRRAPWTPEPYPRIHDDHPWPHTRRHEPPVSQTRPARQPPPAARRRHRRGAARLRIAALLTAASASAAVVTAAAIVSSRSGPGRAAMLTQSGDASRLSGASTTATVVAAGNVGWRLGLPASAVKSAAPGAPGAAGATGAAGASGAASPTWPGLASAPGALVLTARDHRLCPAAATACVDLTRHLTWLQAGGAVTFGPVQMEPGPPGSAHATPRGTFHVSWKAGPTYISTIYGDPMPWAVFFAPGGIAFHGGSLTIPSHGCVHLTLANAHYYNEHLPIGAEVVVF